VKDSKHKDEIGFSSFFELKQKAKQAKATTCAQDE